MIRFAVYLISRPGIWHRVPERLRLWAFDQHIKLNRYRKA